MAFQYLTFTPVQIAHRIKLAMDTNKIIPKKQLDRILLMPGIDHEKPWGFFNGTNQRIPGICDARDVLLLRFKTLFSFKVHCWEIK